ncbi:MAG: hypothetical protein R3C11_05945 [Planctomycetaceae bacterium]
MLVKEIHHLVIIRVAAVIADIMPFDFELFRYSRQAGRLPIITTGSALITLSRIALNKATTGSGR